MDAFPGPTTAVFLFTVGAVAVAFMLGLRRTAQRGSVSRRTALLAGAGLIAWMGATATLSASGVLRIWTLPPPLLGFLGASAALTALVAFSPLGRALATQVPLAWLVGFQAFRVPVEWVLHSLYEAGIVPVQMTYAGLNWDVLSGLSALPVAWLVLRGHGGARLVLVWNIAALALLVNIVNVALLSAPTPLRVFTNEPANVFVTYVPYVWLPAVLVQAALLGHLLVFRALAARVAPGRPAALAAGA
jgi:hypothetical protein